LESRLSKDTIDDVAQRIAVKPKVLMMDIKDMTWLWEETAEELHTWTGLLAALRAIARSYLITRRAEFHGLCPWVNGSS